MNKSFYSKLAITNIRKNSKNYIPYIITCIGTIMMFNIMLSISQSNVLNGASGTAVLAVILNFGTIVIGIFSAVFLFYTNSFLIRRRKKELGLYNILGLEKKHIAKVLFLENVYTSLLSLVIGLIGGVVLNKLMFLLLLKMIGFPVSFGISISVSSLLITIIVFTGIFLVTLLSNLLQIHLAKPIELLKGGQNGEREPKTKWFLTTIGILALSAGYATALAVKSPLAAIGMFFIAVILVMIGTYTLFTTGSIAVLKMLRKNKSYYYKTRNFTAISGMLYRMKQNAVGLANICILSTAVLVVLSTTASLYIGMDDALRVQYPRDVIIYPRANSNEPEKKLSDEEAKKIKEKIDLKAKANNITLENKIDYGYENYISSKSDTGFSLKKPTGAVGVYSSLIIVSTADYNRQEEKSVILADNEILVFGSPKKYGKETMTLENKSFKVKAELTETVLGTRSSMDLVDTYIIVLNDIDVVGKLYTDTYHEKPDGQKYKVGFDVVGSEKDILSLVDGLNEELAVKGFSFYIESVAKSKSEFLSIYGGLLFIGIFLGLLFLMATVLIIYYKQISEGYDDKMRFEIMQKVGMSKIEIKKTISRQILMVFFLPLVFAMIHIAFAFPMITKLLAVFYLTNVSLFLLLTILTIVVFAVIYGFVFSLTARAYYKIVE